MFKKNQEHPKTPHFKEKRPENALFKKEKRPKYHNLTIVTLPFPSPSHIRISSPPAMTQVIIPTRDSFQLLDF